MLEPAQIRRRGAQDFEGYYDHVCAAQGSAPVRAVKAAWVGGDVRVEPWSHQSDGLDAHPVSPGHQQNTSSMLLSRAATLTGTGAQS